MAQVVLVTPESAVSKAFSRFINEKSCIGSLDRLDYMNGWRPNVLQLSETVEKGC